MASPFAEWAAKEEPMDDETLVEVEPRPHVCTNSTRSCAWAARMPIARLCGLFDQLLLAANRAHQVALLGQFWRTIPQHESHFPYMRLLLPQLDGERQLYHMRESKLARLYVDVLALPPQSTDAQRLRHWRDPSKNQLETTCVSDVIFEVLEKRGGLALARPAVVVASSKREMAEGEASVLVPDFFSVEALNALLDRLTSAGKAEERKVVLTQLLHRATAREQRWIIRIILGDMKLRMTFQSILRAFHPAALDVFNSTTDLRYVCDSCMEELEANAPRAAGIFLFQPLRPMLASPITSRKLEQLLTQDVVLLEPKYDGERMMLHVDGERIVYWTRNAKNYSALYGQKFDAVMRNSFKVGAPCADALRPYNLPCGDVLHNAIFDGEFLVYDRDTQGFMDFGVNRTFANAAEASYSLGSEVDGELRWFCYIIFDIVFLNGHSLMQVPLHTRQDVLRAMLVEQPHHVEVVRSTRVRNSSEVLHGLEAAMEAKHEGVVLKVGSSPYVPAERKHNWIKLKPDHIAGMADGIDLVIVGGYYGTKFGQRHLSHFLLAAFDHRSGGGSPSDPGARFHTVCKIGNGYTSEELRAIQSAIDPHCVTMASRAQIPEWLDGWRPASVELIPDVYVHPRSSILVEVFGYSFTNSSNNYRVNFTIRFPRMLRIRWDKSIDDITDTEHLERIRAASADALQRKISERAKLHGDGGDADDALATVLAMKWKRRREGSSSPPAPGSISADAGADLHLRGGHLDRWLAPHGAFVPLRTSAQRPRAVSSSFSAITSLGSANKVDGLFNGYECCVLFTSVESCAGPHAAQAGNRSELERLLLLHGASVVANPSPRTSILLASTPLAPKVRNWVHRNQPSSSSSKTKGLDRANTSSASIIHCSWVVDCVEAGMVLPLTPRAVIYASPELRERFTLMFDAFDDGYVDPATATSMSYSLARAKRALARNTSMSVASSFPAPQCDVLEETSGGGDGDGWIHLAQRLMKQREALEILSEAAGTRIVLAAVKWRPASQHHAHASFPCTWADSGDAVLGVKREVEEEAEEELPVWAKDVPRWLRGAPVWEPEKEAAVAALLTTCEDEWSAAQLCVLSRAVVEDHCGIAKTMVDATHVVDEDGRPYVLLQPTSS